MSIKIDSIVRDMLESMKLERLSFYINWSYKIKMILILEDPRKYIEAIKKALSPKTSNVDFFQMKTKLTTTIEICFISPLAFLIVSSIIQAKIIRTRKIIIFTKAMKLSR